MPFKSSDRCCPAANPVSQVLPAANSLFQRNRIISTRFFGDIERIKYADPDSTDVLSFRYYQPDGLVIGKRLEDHLRFAVCHWHSFVWPGDDPFGGQTFQRS